MSPWDSQQFLRASQLAKLLYLALLHACDDNGNVELDLHYIRGRYFANFRDRLGPYFTELHAASLIEPYESGAKKFCHIPGGMRAPKKNVICPLAPGQQQSARAVKLPGIVIPEEMRAQVDAFIGAAAAANASGKITDGRIHSIEQQVAELIVECGEEAVKFGLTAACEKDAAAIAYVRTVARSYVRRKTPLRVVGGTSVVDSRDLSLDELRERDRIKRRGERT